MPWPRHNNEADSMGVRVNDIVNKAGDEMYYLYDFVDLWLHHITVLAAPPTRPTSARLLEVVGPAAYEGVGGPKAWGEFVAEVEKAALNNTDVEKFFDYYMENFSDYTPHELLRSFAEVSPIHQATWVKSVAAINCFGERAHKNPALDAEQLEELFELYKKEPFDGWTTTHLRWSRRYGRAVEIPEFGADAVVGGIDDDGGFDSYSAAEQALQDFMARQVPDIENAAVTQRIAQRADTRGALPALADFFANPMITEMVRLQGEDDRELSDEHARVIGQRLQRLLALVTLGHSRESIEDKYLADHGQSYDPRVHANLWERLEELFLVTGCADGHAEQDDAALVANATTARMLAMPPEDMARAMAHRIPAHQRVSYITAIVGLLNKVYGRQAREQLAWLRGMSPAAILDEFYNQLSAIYFPPEVYPGVEYQRIVAFIDKVDAATGCIELLKDTHHSLPRINAGIVDDAEAGPQDDAVLAFMRQCLRHVDARWFLSLEEGTDSKRRSY